MVDKKLIKEKLFYLSDNYCVPISIRDKGEMNCRESTCFSYGECVNIVKNA